MVGTVVIHSLAPPPLPDAGTHEDDVLIADLNQRIDDNFKVKVLRGKCLGVAKQLKGAEGGWVEIVPPPAEETAARSDGLINQLQGMKGLGVERIFWNGGEKKLVAVMWFGPALCGWPGVVHGGVIATALSEKMALAATLAEDKGGRVSAAAIPQRLPGTGSHAKMFAPTTQPEEPAQLSVSYLKPKYANEFHVIRVTQSEMPLDQDPQNIVPPEPKGGHEYEATIETLDARILVKAKAKFAHSSAAKGVGGTVSEAAKLSYSDLKEWLWPSRQKSSQI
jgi:acyl-coenzyme A thioesterase PaaI-like protein